MNKILEVEKLYFNYGAERILENLSFSVNAGDFLAISGSNGAGKSTLFKILLGEITPRAGKVLWFNKSISELKDFSKIGYVPQNNILKGSHFPATVSEIIGANLFSELGLFRPVRKKELEKVRSALRLVGMEESEKRLVGKLSGGQQQRVMIARAIVNSPSILLLDEPTTGIDKESSASLYRLLKDLNQKNNVTILMITHDSKKILDKYLISDVLTLSE